MVRLFFILLIVSTALQAQDITRVEYFFDSDPGFGNGINIPVTAAPDLSRDFVVPLNTVSNGFHKFYIRAKSSSAHWSLPQSQPVFVFNNTVTFITRLEYFFDTDPGFGNGISIPITSAIDVSKDFTIPLTTVSSGFHTMHLRARNLSGQWSLLLSRTVFVQVNTQSNAPFPLKRIEYFLDTDPGFGNANTLSVSTTQIDLAVVADLSSATPGFHTLYIRSQDINNQWSLPFEKPFFVTRSGSNIVALEYYYSDGTTQSSVKIYNSFTPGKDLTIDFTAALGELLPNTSYQIYITAINSDGQRSDPTIHAFVTPAVICDPLSAPATTGASICGSGSVSLIASGATAGQTYNWYNTSTGGMPILGVTTNTFITPTLSATTTYYVAIQNGTCESGRTAVTAIILNCNQPPVISTTTITIKSETIATLDLAPLISDPDNNIDLNSLKIVSHPASGAIAGIINNILTIDYSATYFAGKETLEIEVCDLQGSCTQQVLTVDVEGKLNVYNAISPNGDSKNDFFKIGYIELLPDTKTNTVIIYNRWGDVVFKIDDYNNVNNVFTGENKNGNQLPSGIYFYKIEFTNGKESISGYLSLKR